LEYFYLLGIFHLSTWKIRFVSHAEWDSRLLYQRLISPPKACPTVESALWRYGTHIFLLVCFFDLNSTTDRCVVARVLFVEIGAAQRCELLINHIGSIILYGSIVKTWTHIIYNASRYVCFSLQWVLFDPLKTFSKCAW